MIMMTLQMFSTAGCHLCELAVKQVQDLPPALMVQLEIIEIGDDDTLVEQYGTRIPVIKFADSSELNWPFAQQDILQQLARQTSEL